MEIGAGIPFSYTDFLGSPDLKFDDFVDRCNCILDRYDTDTACALIVYLLTQFLRNEEHVLSIIPPNDGRHVLYEKAPGELTVLGHYHPKTVWSRPHDHGRTWAIYGVLTGSTAMYDYEIVTPWAEGQRGTCRQTRAYWIMPGQASLFKIGAVHSHQTHGDSRLIRIEGLNIKRRELKIGGRFFDPE